MRRPVLILHGWSDSYQSFEPLKNLLTGAGWPAAQVLLGNYDSMEDHVTFDDLAVGLDLRLRELAAKDPAFRLTPFGLDCIVHSTGGPVFRHWLTYYLAEVCRGDRARCPVRSIVMLAPANFGSRLAALGKSALAKLFVGGVEHGFATGRQILTGLELGSPFLWDLADRDLFAEPGLYPCDPGQGPFVFVLSGTATYGELKGFVARGANEDGSDGTVRAAAASLNSVRLKVDFTNVTRPEIDVRRVPSGLYGFRLVPGYNHTTLVPRDAGQGDHPTFALIRGLLDEAMTAERHRQLCDESEAANARFYAGQQGGPAAVHAYQQFVVRVRDELGNAVSDYRLEFHVIDDAIRDQGSTWARDAKQVDQLRRYQAFTARLQDAVIAHVQPHSMSTSHRTFFVNIDELTALQGDLRQRAPGAYIAMNLDAMGATPELGYDTDRLRYLPVEAPIRAHAGGGDFTFFRPNTTTLVDIRVQGIPSRRVVEVRG